MPVETRIPGVLVANLIPFSVTTTLLAGRLYARAAILGHVAIDDYLLVVGWGLALANCILATMGTRYGTGMHVQDVPHAFMRTAWKLNFITILCYQLSLGFTKLAISLFYLRVFSVNKASTRELYLLLAFVSSYTAALTLQLLFSCVPVHKTWDVEVPGHCFSILPGFWTHFGCNLLSDIWLIVFAAPRVWRLKMARRQKIALLSTITLGWLVVVAAIVRVVSISKLLESPDPTWAAGGSAIWSSVEINVAIICAAVPALKPVFTRFAPHIVGSFSRKTAHELTPSSDPNGASCGGGKSGASSSWMSLSRNDKTASKLEQHGVQRSDLTSHSREQLANSVGETQWANRLESGASDDGTSEEHDPSGILKSTKITVSSVPIQGVSGV